MRSSDEVAAVLGLRDAGLSASVIAQRVGLPRSTVRDWVAGRSPEAHAHPRRDPREGLPLEYVYLLGLYLGDGCISAHPRGVYRLRVHLDLAYPGIVDECEAAIRAVSPGNKVHRLERKSRLTEEDVATHVEVSSYSKRWAALFPQHGPGRKHERSIELTQWQRELVESYPQLLLRGLIHSDGCRFINTGRGGWRAPRYSFNNLSEGIRRIFRDACDTLGLRWTTSGPDTVYVSRKADVARLDEFIGPKR